MRRWRVLSDLPELIFQLAHYQRGVSAAEAELLDITVVSSRSVVSVTMFRPQPARPALQC